MTRYLVLILAAIILSACSIQGMAEKAVPEPVRDEAHANVTEIMSGDFSSIEAIPGTEGEAFETALSNMQAEVRDGAERARNLVGFQSNVSKGTGEATRKSYNLAWEVETAGGFTTISQTFLSEDGSAPALAAVQIAGSDKSTAAQIRRIGMAARIMGVALLIGIALVALFLLRRRRMSPND